jgi:hypothetical protein
MSALRLACRVNGNEAVGHGRIRFRAPGRDFGFHRRRHTFCPFRHRGERHMGGQQAIPQAAHLFRQPCQPWRLHPGLDRAAAEIEAAHAASRGSGLLAERPDQAVHRPAAMSSAPSSLTATGEQKGRSHHSDGGCTRWRGIPHRVSGRHPQRSAWPASGLTRRRSARTPCTARRRCCSRLLYKSLWHAVATGPVDPGRVFRFQ